MCGKGGGWVLAAPEDGALVKCGAGACACGGVSLVNANRCESHPGALGCACVCMRVYPLVCVRVCLCVLFVLGVPQCVRLLLAYGADIRPENDFGKDAFQTAMYKQRIGCIRLLQAAWNNYRWDCSRPSRGFPRTPAAAVVGA